MGKRLRVVKQCEVYGDHARFNWNYEKFANLLESMGANVHCYDEYSYDRFEVPTEHFEFAMGCMEKIANGDEIKDLKPIDDEMWDFDPDEVMSALSEFDGDYQDPAYILETMRLYYDERDKNSGYMIFVAY